MTNLELPDGLTELKRYINAIRNKNKKAYAFAYAKAMLNDHDTSGIENGGQLSYMAMQGVRLQINRLILKD